MDGASDEGLSHHKVQFYWTKWHLHREKVATLVTTCNSGASYMNRVELQNGCLTIAHSNIFIPSTFHGSCLQEGGKIDKEVLHKNLETAIDVYIQRCNGCPCGSTTIHLFKAHQAEYEKREESLSFEGL